MPSVDKGAGLRMNGWLWLHGAHGSPDIADTGGAVACLAPCSGASMPAMPDTQIDFSAPAELRKWPSLKKQRVSASLGARPYMISEGTLDECIQQFMQLRETQRHLYEIRVAPQSDLVAAILSTEHIVELARLRDFIGK
jgi:hypothetical protein